MYHVQGLHLLTPKPKNGTSEAARALPRFFFLFSLGFLLFYLFYFFFFFPFLLKHNNTLETERKRDAPVIYIIRILRQPVPDRSGG